MAFHGQFVVRVYLDGQILLGIDEFDEQREFAVEAFVVGFAYQCSFVFVDHLCQVLACIGTVGYDGFVARNVRDFPAFAYLCLIAVQMFERNDFFTSPQGGFQNRLKF